MKKLWECWRLCQKLIKYELNVSQVSMSGNNTPPNALCKIGYCSVFGDAFLDLASGERVNEWF